MFFRPVYVMSFKELEDGGSGVVSHNALFGRQTSVLFAKKANIYVRFKQTKLENVFQPVCEGCYTTTSILCNLALTALHIQTT